jgi:hypothetical protein
MKEDDNGKQSWWVSLPGILTGIAAVITAIVALLGFFGSNKIISPVEISTKGKDAIIISNDSIVGVGTTSNSTTPNATTPNSTTPIVANSIEILSSVSFMNGTWKNYFGDGGASENVTINNTSYLVDNSIAFELIDFKYNKETNEISFIKKSLKDPRRLLNTLKVVSDKELVGSEENGNDKYDVKYVRN